MRQAPSARGSAAPAVDFSLVAPSWPEKNPLCVDEIAVPRFVGSFEVHPRLSAIQPNQAIKRPIRINRDKKRSVSQQSTADVAREASEFGYATTIYEMHAWNGNARHLE